MTTSPSTDEIIEKILKNLTPDLLLEKRFVDENKHNPLYGHCFHASQALWLMTGMIYKPYFGARDWRGGTHWWLKTEKGILDITADQYYSLGYAPPYEHGRPSTWRIAKRTIRLLNRISGFWE